MPRSIHDPATRVPENSIAYFEEYEAYYQLNGNLWILLPWMP